MFIFKGLLSNTFFPRNNIANGQALYKDEEVFQNSFYDVSKPTKFIIHGWLSSGSSDTCITIKDSYLKHFDYNVIVVDWSEIAGNYLYPIPMAYTKPVGIFYAALVDFVIDLGTDPKQIHLIGHSLGAHISGFTGGFVKKAKIGRVTGETWLIGNQSNIFVVYSGAIIHVLSINDY